MILVGQRKLMNLAVVPIRWQTDRVLSVYADRSENDMLTLFRSLVRTRIEYSYPVWNHSLTGDIKKLESNQRAFTRHIRTRS